MMKLPEGIHVKNVRRASEDMAGAHAALGVSVTNHAERHSAALDVKRKNAEIAARIADGISAINNKV